MKISAFFTDVLGANLRNKRWSWGSYDPMTDRVFLRVWEDEIRIQGGAEVILVARAVPRRRSSGYSERMGHLEQIKNGASGYGVLCTAVDPHTDGAKAIKSFDEMTVLRFGPITKYTDGWYAEIAGRDLVSNLSRQRTAQSTVADDIRSLVRRNIDSTIKTALVNARVGQGAFRTQVLLNWGQRCAVTMTETLDAVRASHIKPWRQSTDEERLDPENGLPLVANLDALFDAGFISFDARAKLIVSKSLSAKERSIFNLQGQQLAKTPGDRTLNYLKYHRSKIFRD